MAMQDLLALGADRYVAIDLAREAAGMFLLALGRTWQRANGPDQRQEYREKVVNFDLLPWATRPLTVTTSSRPGKYWKDCWKVTVSTTWARASR